MKRQWRRGSLLLAATFCSTSVLAELSHEFGSKGYFRVGTGLSVDDASQEVFQAPGAGAKYRLGNENDNYLELDLYDTMRMDPNGPYDRDPLLVKGSRITHSAAYY